MNIKIAPRPVNAVSWSEIGVGDTFISSRYPDKIFMRTDDSDGRTCVCLNTGLEYLESIVGVMEKVQLDAVVTHL